jgi:colanic acid/amylovoran biosynthesis glycosyltransferase
MWPAETFLQWKLAGLAARGLRVTVATSSRRGRARLRGVRVRRYPHWEESRARVVVGLLGHLLLLALRRPGRVRPTVAAARNPLHTPSRGGRWPAVLRLRWYLPLARLSPDVVHFEWNTAAVMFLPLTAVWRCPAVVSCHGSDLNVRPHLRDAERWRESLARSFGAAQAVHCVSAALAAEAARYGCEPARTWLIRPAIDPAAFLPATRAPGDVLRMVSVSDFRWLKGHEHGLLALRRLLDRGVAARLDLLGGDPPAAVGESSDRPRVVEAIADLGLAEHVRLHGHVGSHRVRAALQGADVLLHSSLSEGIPTAVLEAMACELPVVVGDCGGVREAVSDGVEGFVVPLRDPDAAADALEAVWRDRPRARAMGAAGRRRVVAEFTLQRQLDRFAELYRRVAVAGRREPSRPSPLRPPAPAGQAAPDLRVLSVADLTWRAGLDHALHAVRLAADRGVACEHRIVGEGPYLDALRFARHQLELEGRAAFVSPGERSLDAHLDWADVLLDATLTGPPSPALAEAQARGLAVVSTATLPRRDPRALAEALTALIAAASAPHTADRWHAPPR